MMHKVFFVQECPTCGRSLEIGVAYLGREVYCRHCHARFVAQPSDTPVRDPAEADSLIRRAEQLIEESSFPASRSFGPRLASDGPWYGRQ
jgi:hypothetical protein